MQHRRPAATPNTLAGTRTGSGSSTPYIVHTKLVTNKLTNGAPLIMLQT